MKVVVNEIGTCRRGLEIEVPGEAVRDEIERSYREYQRHARLPGFRQGKVPLEVVRQRFGKEVRDDVVARVVRESVLKALEEKRLEPIEAPVLDHVDYDAGKPLTLKASFEVRPVVSVSGYHGMKATVRRRTVNDEMVEASLGELADRAAKLEAVEGRPVQKGDYIVGTMSCRFLKGQGKDLESEPLFLEAGAENNHPDFNAAILGLSPGENRSFEIAYPDDYASEALRGRTVVYTVVLKEIKKKVVPPISDELARELGQFAGLAELRAKVRQELERRAAETERLEAKDLLLGELVAHHTFEVPPSLVESHIDGRLEGAIRDLMGRGIDPTKAKIDWKEEREKLRDGAVKSVRAMILLEAIAAQERIETGDEDVNAWLRDEARRHNASVSALKEQLSQNGRLEPLRRQIVREKSLDFVLNGATITREEK
jgi:trigger factor